MEKTMNFSLDKLTLEEIKHSLHHHHYVQVPFPISSTVFKEALEAFFKFLEEPEDIKTHIDFKLVSAHRRGDIGFKRRTPEEELYRDSKEFFHFHPIIFEKYEDFLKENPVVLNFMRKAEPIWEASYETVHTILGKFEVTFPGVLKKIFASEAPHVLLRFLRYHWGQSGKYLAKPHFDAGSFTLAIAESDPGLRIGCDPHSLKPVEHKKGHAMFFFSSNCGKVIETKEIKPAWHDVVQRDETKIGKPYARWAIVAFVEALGVEALPRSETHKWGVPQDTEQALANQNVS